MLYFLAPWTYCKNLMDDGCVTIRYNTSLIINSAGGGVCILSCFCLFTHLLLLVHLSQAGYLSDRCIQLSAQGKITVSNSVAETKPGNSVRRIYSSYLLN